MLCSIGCSIIFWSRVISVGVDLGSIGIGLQGLLPALIGLMACCTTKRHKLLLKCLWHPSEVSFPSAPSLPSRWGFLALLDLLESLELLEFPAGLDLEVPGFEPEFVWCLCDDLLDLAAPGGLEDLGLSEVSFLLLLGVGAFTESREISCCQAQ